MSCCGAPAGSCPSWAQQSCPLSWEQPGDAEQEVSCAGIAALNSLSCPRTCSMLPLPECDPPLMTFSCSPESLFVLENTFPLCLLPPHCSAPGRYYLLRLSSIFLIPLGDACAGCGGFSEPPQAGFGRTDFFGCPFSPQRPLFSLAPGTILPLNLGIFPNNCKTQWAGALLSLSSPGNLGKSKQLAGLRVISSLFHSL